MISPGGRGLTRAVPARRSRVTMRRHSSLRARLFCPPARGRHSSPRLIPFPRGFFFCRLAPPFGTNWASVLLDCVRRACLPAQPKARLVARSKPPLPGRLPRVFLWARNRSNARLSPPPRARYMRCYLMRGGHIAAVELLDAKSDEEAVEQCRALFEEQKSAARGSRT